MDNPTLNRFYSLHYTLPFVLAGLSIFHIACLHQYGSTNPLGVNTQTSTIPFGTYFGSKDMLGLLILLFVFVCLVFFYPEYLGHPDNLSPANPYSTPQHIVPEFYFLYLYAILRSIPSKSVGVIAVAVFFIALIALPFVSTTTIGSPKFRKLSERLYWIFVGDVLLLTRIGGEEIADPTVIMGQIATIVLFIYLLVIIPFTPLVEHLLYINSPINSPIEKLNRFVVKTSYLNLSDFKTFNTFNTNFNTFNNNLITSRGPIYEVNGGRVTSHRHPLGGNPFITNTVASGYSTFGTITMNTRIRRVVGVLEVSTNPSDYKNDLKFLIALQQDMSKCLSSYIEYLSRQEDLDPKVFTLCIGFFNRSIKIRAKTLERKYNSQKGITGNSNSSSNSSSSNSSSSSRSSYSKSNTKKSSDKVKGGEGNRQR